MRAIRRPVSEEEMLAAAKQLRGLLNAYIDRGYRGSRSAVGNAVEPLLRYYVREYAPEQQRREETLEHKLASAAWQLLMRRPKGRDLDRMLTSIARIRREHDPRDSWLKDREKVTKSVRAVLAPPPAGPGRPPSEIALANRMYEVLGAGHIGHDSRRGVRGKREELLLETRASAELIVTSQVITLVT